jgi:hypothetical protein
MIREKTPGRNDPCPCNSGKKAKRCCLNKIKFLANLPPNVRERVVANALLQRIHAPDLKMVERAREAARQGNGRTIQEILDETI